MLTISDVELLRSEELRKAIEENIERDPQRVALDKRVPYASLVATQIKYLQRARKKLPHLYEARCIIPPRAFEQSSSMESAERKGISGDTLLDLSCGLGIDAMAAARNFRRVVAVERDEVLAEVVRYNLTLLGVDNVEIVTASSEDYVATTTEHFDWIFVDPDRRSSEGKKMVCMEDCSPNVLDMMPRLEKIASRVAIKLSPLFDVDEALRLFPNSEVEVVSMAGECKELNIYTHAERGVVRVAAVGVGEWLFDSEEINIPPSSAPFDAMCWHYLIVPDVAVQKARVAGAAFKEYATMWSNNGFAFAEDIPEGDIPGRVYHIERIEHYRPKELKREMKGVGVEILKRDTRLSVDEVRKAIGAKAGSERMLAITTISGDNWVIYIKPLSL